MVYTPASVTAPHLTFSLTIPPLIFQSLSPYLVCHHDLRICFAAISLFGAVLPRHPVESSEGGLDAYSESRLEVVVPVVVSGREQKSPALGATLWVGEVLC